MLICNYSTDYLPLWRPRGQATPLTSNLVQRGGFLRFVWCGGLVMFNVSGSFVPPRSFFRCEEGQILLATTLSFFQCEEGLSLLATLSFFRCEEGLSLLAMLSFSWCEEGLSFLATLSFFWCEEGLSLFALLSFFWCGGLVMLSFVWCERKFCPSLLFLSSFDVKRACPSLLCFCCLSVNVWGFVPRYVVFPSMCEGDCIF